MPELPEVETVVRDLNKKIKGDFLVGFETVWPKALKNVSLAKFKKELAGRKILCARRLGKNIFIDLSGGKTIYLHLKMTGHLLVKSKIKGAAPPGRGDDNKKDFFKDRVNQYIRHIFHLRDEKGGIKKLEFSDLRKFGKIVWVETNEINRLKEIKGLGVDALSREFDLAKWQEILKQKRGMKIGVLLLEQNLIAGIGNIYRAEILFAAGVSPHRLAGSLKKKEKEAIFQSIKKILAWAVRLRGTSDSDYRDTSGAPGGFQKVLKVYNKEKEKCPRKNCQGVIKRDKMGQRSVFWCQKCQK